MKTYSTVPEEVERIIANMRDEWHSPDLDGVTVSTLFVYDMDADKPVLSLGGYPAQAVVSITPIKQRALGVADAVIIIDRSNWLTLTQEQREALLDHELYHLQRVVDASTELPKFDAIDRPRLKIRPHDRQIGVFTEILRRHGKASAEFKMIGSVMDEAGQLYWDFEAKDQKPKASNIRLVSSNGVSATGE